MSEWFPRFQTFSHLLMGMSEWFERFQIFPPSGLEDLEICLYNIVDKAKLQLQQLELLEQIKCFIYYISIARSRERM